MNKIYTEKIEISIENDKSVKITEEEEIICRICL